MKKISVLEDTVLMKKFFRSVSVLLILTLVLSSVSAFIYADEPLLDLSALYPSSDSQPFAVSFSDVKEDQWFYEYVSALASSGIIEGYEDGTFLPHNNITRAEFTKLVVSCMGYELATDTVEEFSDVKKADWFFSYVTTALNNGIIDKADYADGFKPNEKITRKEVAKFVSKAIKAPTNVYASPFADTDDEYVVSLYVVCLMQGSATDSNGKPLFLPDNNISRAEVSAVISRLIEYNTDSKAYVERKTAEYGMTELKLLGLPFSKEDFFCLVLKSGFRPGCFFLIECQDSVANVSEISDSLICAFTDCSGARPELFTFMGISITVTTFENTSTIKFCIESTQDDFTTDDLLDIRKKSRNKAKEISILLFKDNENLSELEKAKIIHSYLIKNISYSEDLSDKTVFTGFGALINKTAVCQGYTAAFNELCYYAGIKSCAVQTENHTWNALLTNGEIIYFDSTWDDPLPLGGDGENFKFCGVTKENVISTHGNFKTPLEFYFDLH